MGRRVGSFLNPRELGKAAELSLFIWLLLSRFENLPFLFQTEDLKHGRACLLNGLAAAFWFFLGSAPALYSQKWLSGPRKVWIESCLIHAFLRLPININQISDPSFVTKKVHEHWLSLSHEFKGLLVSVRADRRISHPTTGARTSFSTIRTTSFFSERRRAKARTAGTDPKPILQKKVFSIHRMYFRQLRSEIQIYNRGEEGKRLADDRGRGPKAARLRLGRRGNMKKDRIKLSNRERKSLKKRKKIS